MTWDIHADVSRTLTQAERELVFAALEEIVPDSGCVGLQKGVEEVYFTVEASSEAEATALAKSFLARVRERSEVPVSFELSLQARPLP